MGQSNNKSEGYLVDLWEKIFSVLAKISIFSLIRHLVKDTGHNFVDKWVLGNFIAAIVSSLLVYYLPTQLKGFLYVIVLYGIVRVFEILIYQINLLLFDPYRAKLKGKPYAVKSIRRILIALLHNFGEIMFWYTTMTIVIVKLSGGDLQGWISFVTSSMLCITTFNKQAIEESSSMVITTLSIVGTCEVISGLIMTVISLGRFIGVLPAVDEIKEGGN